MSQPSLEPPTPPHLLRFERVRSREAYNIEDVDEFIRRAHHALEYRDGSMTARDVHGARFRPVRLKEGYEMGQVDEELDRVAAAFQGSEAAQRRLEPPTPRDQLRFTRVLFQPSYDSAEVDEFFRRAHDALESRDRSITLSDAQSVRFKPRFKSGYEMASVDEELDRISGARQRLEPPSGG
jgi:DivIVA domain-containing protein